MARTSSVAHDPATTRAGNGANGFDSSTNAAHFDATYSKIAFKTAVTGSFGDSITEFSTSSPGAGNHIWAHALCYVTTGGNTDGSITQVVPAFGGNGSTTDRIGIYQEDDVDSMVFAQCNDGHTALTNSVNISTVPLDTLFTIDIRKNNLNYELFIDGTLAGTITPGAAVSPMNPRMDITAAGNGWTGSYFSQLHVSIYADSDAVGSIGSNVVTLYPEAEDTPNQWTGDIASLNTPNSTNGQSGPEYTGTTGQQQMFTVEDLPAAAAGRAIESIAINVRGRDDLTTTEADVLVDVGGGTPVATDSVGSTLKHNYFSVKGNIYADNSLTSADWTIAEVNSLKIGFTTT